MAAIVEERHEALNLFHEVHNCRNLPKDEVLGVFQGNRNGQAVAQPDEDARTLICDVRSFCFNFVGSRQAVQTHWLQVTSQRFWYLHSKPFQFGKRAAPCP